MCGNGLDANPRPTLSLSLSATPSVRPHTQHCLCFWEFCWILCSVCRAQIPLMSRGHKKPNAISKFLMCEISNLRFTIFLCWITFTPPSTLTPLSRSLSVKASSSQHVLPDVRSFSCAGVGLQIHLASALLYASFWSWPMTFLWQTPLPLLFTATSCLRTICLRELQPRLIAPARSVWGQWPPMQFYLLELNWPTAAIRWDPIRTAKKTFSNAVAVKWNALIKLFSPDQLTKLQAPFAVCECRTQSWLYGQLFMAALIVVGHVNIHSVWSTLPSLSLLSLALLQFVLFSGNKS